MSDATILLIEDEPQIRRCLRSALPQHNYTLLEAAHAPMGMALVAEKRPKV